VAPGSIPESSRLTNSRAPSLSSDTVSPNTSESFFNFAAVPPLQRSFGILASRKNPMKHTEYVDVAKVA